MIIVADRLSVVPPASAVGGMCMASGIKGKRASSTENFFMVRLPWPRRQGAGDGRRIGPNQP